LRREFDHVLDQSELDDVMSQASQRAWRSGKNYEASRGSLRAWFYVIARNCALRVVECKRGPGALRLVADIDSLARPPIPSVDESNPKKREQFARDLHLCIDKLPSQQRAVILADLAAGGIASTENLVAELKTTPNSIYVARANARKALRAALLAMGHKFDERARIIAREATP
jgi:DNA-directed RNA polymerase specialized sigma24 family protein